MAPPVPGVPGLTAIVLPGHIETHRIDDSAESWKVTSSLAASTSVSPEHIQAFGSDDSAESRAGIESTSGRGTSVLRQRADAAKRAFNRADALVSLAQGYLRGDRPHRSPIEITLTVADSSLRAGAVDLLEAGEIGESFISTETARRLSCDAGVIEVIEDADGMPLLVGRKRRTIADVAPTTDMSTSTDIRSSSARISDLASAIRMVSWSPRYRRLR
jgi:hypothetical protein